MARFRLVATAKLSLWRVSNPVGVVKIPRAEKEQNRVGEVRSNPVGVVKIPRAENEQNRAHREIFEAERDQNRSSGSETKKKPKSPNRRDKAKTDEETRFCF